MSETTETPEWRQEHERGLGARKRLGKYPFRMIIDDGPDLMTPEQRADSKRRLAEWFDDGHMVAPKPSPTPLHPLDVLTRLTEVL